MLDNGRVEKPLPLKWVFTYKFDERGHLIKYKARIYVHKDLQEACDESTYAATLVAKSFRTLYAVAARFNLEVKQFDVTAAFLNTRMDKSTGKRVYCRLPDGFEELGFLKTGQKPTDVAELDRALYGLRESPLL